MKSEERRPDMRVELCGVPWKNPVTTAAGTFAPRESGQFYDIRRLGAVTTKGVSPRPWEGNPTPRIAETYGGMLNAVGLQNPGVEHYITQELPDLKSLGVTVIANMAGHTVEEYREVAEKLGETEVDMLELNISCPNIRRGGAAFGTDPVLTAQVVRSVRRATAKPLIVKLSPNVTDIGEIARAAEDAGADCLSLINTLLGMRIDPRRRCLTLANGTGGLSGPAVKPVALRMVWQVRQAVQLPIIGMGGIFTGEDAAEFLMAGADAVAVGTAALVKPTAPADILEELEAFMAEQGYRNVRELREALKGGAFAR
ncbi:MAG: dihydroorotate dehydrogenase [Bacillota bacterium]|nr:dihydroorotate dehydrogenase [Bacillota bacterium]